MDSIESPVRVGPSEYGLGVFSLKSFTTDDWISQIEGEIIHDANYESDYCMSLGENSALEPTAPYRFLNHSCQPNCSLVEVEVEYDDGTFVTELWLQGEKDIAPGEQMTIDYAWPAESAIPCRCGSAGCRNWIVAYEEIGLIEADKFRSPHPI